VRSNSGEPLPRVTVALIVVFTFVLILEALASSIPFNRALVEPSEAVYAALGANSFNLTVVNGQWWRLLTATLLHGGITHLGFNSLNTWVLGALIESRLGWLRLMAIFVLTGILASVTSMVLIPRNGTSVGASGAIMGMFGFLIVWGVLDFAHFVVQIRRNAVILVLVLAPGFIIPGVDNVAHIGGLLAGFFLGFVWERLPETFKTILGVFSGLAFLAAVGMVVMHAIPVIFRRFSMSY
jgi:rhomboid protease GluP